MPNQNGTGPFGGGPRSGRGAGRCGRSNRAMSGRQNGAQQEMMQQGFRRLDASEDNSLQQQMADLKQQLATMSQTLQELSRQRD
ncbi:MAG: cytoplasmic protein [Desulfuromonas sp.]|nr:MAG: cytoplasmic protein [Desulfuromonas sp.]